MLSVVFRTLRREFRIRCPDPATADAFDFIEARPEIEDATLVPIDLHVERRDGFLRLSGPQGVLLEGSATKILERLQEVRWRAFAADHPGGALVVGPVVRLQGGHVLLTGGPKVGKSVLAAYLAANGFDIATDWGFVVEPGFAAPLPIAIRIAETDARRLPSEAAEALRRSPRITGWSGEGYLSISPGAFGRPWRAGPAPVQHIAILHANHGGRSRTRPLDADAALDMVLSQALLPAAGRALALAGLRSMVGRARCWDVSVGRLGDFPAIFRGWAALSAPDAATPIWAVH